MKIVFVASLESVSASGRQRLWALEQCGAEVSYLDKESYKSPLGRLSGKVSKFLKQPSLSSNTHKLQQELMQLCKKVQPDIIWLEWAKEYTLGFIQQLKKEQANARLISFLDDNPWGDRMEDQWMWKDYFKIVRLFDVHIMKRERDVVELGKMGVDVSKCILWEHGMYSPVFFPAKENIEKKYPVSFIGTCMDQRIELIGYLLEQRIPIHIFGNSWIQRSDLPKRFPTQFHKAVEGDAYAEVIRKSSICLGLVSHSNHDEWTMRTYEVPACAGVLLAERTPTHVRLFKEDINAAFFSNKEECVAKLLDLLSDTTRCVSMGTHAYETFVQNGYSLENRMQTLIQKINTIKQA